MRIQRAFLRRVVSYLIDAGVRQFVDLGSGIPTAGNVHEVAHAVDPDSRVLYVDNKSDVVAESRSILNGKRNVAVALADLTRPDQVLDSPERKALIDLSQPVAVLLIDVLHLVPDEDDPTDLVGNYLDALCSGSYLSISHTTSRDTLVDGLVLANRMYHTLLPQLTVRDPIALKEFFKRLDVIEPGIVPIPLWRPQPDQDTDRNPKQFPGYAGLGRKP